MEWTSDAFILATRKHGEADLILEVMTPAHGRHLGLVRSGRSRRHSPILQPGNSVRATWKARLISQLGRFQIEPLTARAGSLMGSATALNGLQHLAALLRLLPERDSHPQLYSALSVLVEHLDRPNVAAPLLVRFELQLLQELGYGLDLSTCAATGLTDDLAYVSPRSGRAVSRDAGKPYHDKLLQLPSFLVDGQRQQGSEISYPEISQGFQLTHFFLERLHRGRSGEDAPAPPFAASRAGLVNVLEGAYRKTQPWDFINLPEDAVS
ncbi:DNA repair protein RecO [Roseibium sp. CAU 1637]|uniref:DNA repair protein RecO n=1 Tax=Roseibium limicola TaxID=2816037 RepID=A0A939J8L8_9HYPH|nr:DNA repair protein RecO [Roseibium limicola]MBO0345009.1 DNA repair protein RecO [Roseibium limicola]